MTVQRLPLFPLHVVLFPRGAMPLHIFEPRYQEMLDDVLDGDGRFGMIYHDPDRQGPFLAEEGRVGCVARIHEHETLVEGRSLVLVVGEERFAIREYVESGRKYYEAMVEPYGDWELPDPELVERRRDVLALFVEVLERTDLPEDRQPDLDPGYDVTFPMAALIQVDPRWQQELLEMRREPERLDRLETLLQLALDQGSEDS